MISKDYNSSACGGQIWNNSQNYFRRGFSENMYVINHSGTWFVYPIQYASSHGKTIFNLTYCSPQSLRKDKNTYLHHDTCPNTYCMISKVQGLDLFQLRSQIFFSKFVTFYVGCSRLELGAIPKYQGSVSVGICFTGSWQFLNCGFRNPSIL